MINYSTTNSNLKRGICNYSKKISKGLKRPEIKFVGDMVYGMLASGSSMLSEISRDLNEKIPLIKTVNRLSRNLADFSDDEKEEKFIIIAKKNRNVIYKGKTQNILDVANKFKGKYALKFKDKSGRTVDVKISILPIELCEFKGVPLNLAVVYGLW